MNKKKCRKCDGKSYFKNGWCSYHLPDKLRCRALTAGSSRKKQCKLPINRKRGRKRKVCGQHMKTRTENILK